MSSIVEKKWEYEGFQCVVKMQEIGHRCGYVGIPKGHELYCADYDEIDIGCHGGLTYADFTLLDDNSNDIWWIGFDCAHWGDLRDYESAKKLYKDNEKVYEMICRSEEIDSKTNYSSFGEIRTLEYCVEQCESIVNQIINKDYEYTPDEKEE